MGRIPTFSSQRLGMAELLWTGLLIHLIFAGVRNVLPAPVGHVDFSWRDARMETSHSETQLAVSCLDYVNDTLEP